MVYFRSKVKEGKIRNVGLLFLRNQKCKGGVKMKGNKKILAVAILLLLITVGFTTYAIYKSSATATGTVTLAAWKVEVDGEDMVSQATFDLDLSNVNWTVHNGKAGTIAPGDSGTITIPVDATGTQVDVILEAALGTVTGLPTGMTVTMTSGATQNIPYDENDMTANVVLAVEWETEDSTTRNPLDVSAGSSTSRTVSIPVTLTARQAKYTAGS